MERKERKKVVDMKILTKKTVNLLQIRGRLIHRKTDGWIDRLIDELRERDKRIWQTRPTDKTIEALQGREESGEKQVCVEQREEGRRGRKKGNRAEDKTVITEQREKKPVVKFEYWARIQDKRNEGRCCATRGRENPEENEWVTKERKKERKKVRGKES